MKNIVLISFLYHIIANLKKENNSNAEKLEYIAYMIKERLCPYEELIK